MIAQAIRDIAKGEGLKLVLAKVDAIDEAARTCDVSPLDGTAQFLGVRLQAQKEQLSGILALPTVGSHVVLGCFDNEEAVILLTSELSKIRIIAGNESLFEVLNSLIELLKIFQLATNMGPTIRIMPQVETELNLIQQRLRKMME